MTEKEYQDIKLRADALNMSVRKFMRDIATGEIEETSEASRLSSFEFDAASILTGVAGDLARIADAAACGIVTGVEPRILKDLHEAAHLLGMKLVGARAGVR